MVLVWTVLMVLACSADAQSCASTTSHDPETFAKAGIEYKYFGTGMCTSQGWSLITSVAECSLVGELIGDTSDCGTGSGCNHNPSYEGTEERPSGCYASGGPTLHWNPHVKRDLGAPVGPDGSCYGYYCKRKKLDKETINMKSLTLTRGTYLSLATDPIPKSSAGTVCTWIKWSSLNEGNSYLVAAGGHTGGSFGHSSFMTSTELYVWTNSASAKGLRLKISPNPIPKGRWTHLCYSFEPTVSIRAYINGKALPNIASAASWGTNKKLTPGLTVNVPNNGLDSYSGDVMYDELFLWTPALSAAEVSQVYRRPFSMNSLSFFSLCAAWFKFEGDLNDSSGKGLKLMGNLPVPAFSSDVGSIEAPTTSPSPSTPTTIMPAATTPTEDKDCSGCEAELQKAILETQEELTAKLKKAEEDLQKVQAHMQKVTDEKQKLEENSQKLLSEILSSADKEKKDLSDKVIKADAQIANLKERMKSTKDTDLKLLSEMLSSATKEKEELLVKLSKAEDQMVKFQEAHEELNKDCTAFTKASTCRGQPRCLWTGASCEVPGCQRDMSFLQGVAAMLVVLICAAFVFMAFHNGAGNAIQYLGAAAIIAIVFLAMVLAKIDDIGLFLVSLPAAMSSALKPTAVP